MRTAGQKHEYAIEYAIECPSSTLEYSPLMSRKYQRSSPRVPLSSAPLGSIAQPRVYARECAHGRADAHGRACAHTPLCVPRGVQQCTTGVLHRLAPPGYPRTPLRGPSTAAVLPVAPSTTRELNRSVPRRCRADTASAPRACSAEYPLSASQSSLETRKGSRVLNRARLKYP